MPIPWARCQEYQVNRTVSTFQDIQKNLSLALKAIPKGESKKVLNNVNNYNMAVTNEYSSKATNEVTPLFDG